MNVNTLLAVVLVVVVCCGDASSDLQVASDSRYCTQHPTFISCDFLNVKEPVILGSQGIRGSNTVNTVYVHNTEELRVRRDVCVSLVAFNVGKITHDGDTGRRCDGNHIFSYKLVDSRTNAVPAHTAHLDMQRSAANEVTIDANLRSFAVVDSEIGRLRIAKSVSGVKMKTESSVIEYLERVHLESRSQFAISNSTIKGIAKGGVSVTDSSVNLFGGSVVTSVDQAVVLGRRGSLTIKNTDGRLTLAGPHDAHTPSTPSPTPTDKKPPGVPQTKTPQPNQCHSSFIWVPPTVLALLEAIVICVNCSHWFPSLRVRPRRGLEEGGGAGRFKNDDLSHTYSSLYYNTEIKGVSRRQNVDYHDKYS